MTRDQLEHAIRAACDVSGDNELWIFGSQAILGEFLRLLLIEKMIEVKTLTERINLLNVKKELQEHLLYWVKITAEEL